MGPGRGSGTITTDAAVRPGCFRAADPTLQALRNPLEEPLAFASPPVAHARRIRPRGAGRRRDSCCATRSSGRASTPTRRRARTWCRRSFPAAGSCRRNGCPSGRSTTAMVARIPVDEGQSVRRGDILVVLDDRDARAALTQAQAAVAQAAARMRQLRELALPAAEQGLVQAQANLVLARQQYQRAQDLKAKGFVSAVRARRRQAQSRRRGKPAARRAAAGRDEQPVRQRPDARAGRARAGAGEPRHGAGQARPDHHPRARRRHADRPQRRAGQRGAAGQGIDGPGARPARRR